MKLVMLSALHVAKTVFELLKVQLGWCNKMFVEVSCCMLKIWSNKAKPKKLTNRLSILMMLFFFFKSVVESKGGRFDNVVDKLLLCSLLRPNG